ncbi:MAG: NAD(P)H-dependent oxidoreductase [Stellaceae bacterium]
MKLLHIDSSVTGEASASRQLSGAIVGEFTRAEPALKIIRRDLGNEPILHLDSTSLGQVRPVGATANGNSDGALDEFLTADIVVIGAPMYNFTVPSQLKAWVDRILVAGRTFRYTEIGAKGLVSGKSIIIASTRGGLYSPGTANEANDFQERYLRAVFRFIGLDSIEVVRAEGLALGPGPRDMAMGAAFASVIPLVQRLATPAAA